MRFNQEDFREEAAAVSARLWRQSRRLGSSELPEVSLCVEVEGQGRSDVRNMEILPLIRILLILALAVVGVFVMISGRGEPRSFLSWVLIILATLWIFIEVLMRIAAWLGLEGGGTDRANASQEERSGSRAEKRVGGYRGRMIRKIHRTRSDPFFDIPHVSNQTLQLIRIEDAATHDRLKTYPEDIALCCHDPEKARVIIEGIAYRYLVRAADITRICPIRRETASVLLEYRIERASLSLVLTLFPDLKLTSAEMFATQLAGSLGDIEIGPMLESASGDA